MEVTAIKSSEVDKIIMSCSGGPLSEEAVAAVRTLARILALSQWNKASNLPVCTLEDLELEAYSKMITTVYYIKMRHPTRFLFTTGKHAISDYIKRQLRRHYKDQMIITLAEIKRMRK